ncbi:MAG: hypothetical protein GY795_31910 [Desulfobacterales bacterium]|nr:hypothetical protein [Desulfobacterales bacterium]
MKKLTYPCAEKEHRKMKGAEFSMIHCVIWEYVENIAENFPYFFTGRVGIRVEHYNIVKIYT